MSPVSAHVEPKSRALMTIPNVLPVYRTGELKKFITVLSLASIADAVRSRKVVVDYDYQRGVKIVRRKSGDIRIPMVDMKRVSDMFYRIVQGDFYGGALTWNLRQGEVEFHYDELDMTLYIFSGTPTIPDSNHRHQACLLVMSAFEEGKLSDFSPHEYEFPLVIEHIGLDGEAGLFYEYNQLAKPANNTRAKYLHQQDPVNKLTGMVSQETFLKNHVEVVMNSISKNSTMIVTFNALSSAIEEAYGVELKGCSDAELLSHKEWLVDFLNTLSEIRPELQSAPVARRQRIRESLIIDSALSFNAFLKLSRRLRGKSDWKVILGRLKSDYEHHDHPGGRVTWKGDFFSRANPLWRNGVLMVKTNSKGAEQVSLQNSGASKDFLSKSLLEFLGVS